MRTVSYSIEANTDDAAGGGFQIVETETLHTSTGDEQAAYVLPMWCETREAAQAIIDNELAR